MRGQGFVLAGGKSSRMGLDKAFLIYQGQTLLERSILTLQAAGLPVTIVTSRSTLNRSRFTELGPPVLLDEIAEAGPLGGIYTALSAATGKDNYILACDMPLMEAVFFSRLGRFSQDFDLVVPADSEGRLHPLCGYYSTLCCAPLRRLLDQNKRRVDALLEAPHIRSLIVQAPQLGIPDSFFLNVNTLEDLQALG